LFFCVIFLKCYLVFINPVTEKEVWDIKYIENYCEHLICSTDFEQVNGNDENQIMKSESTKSVWVSCISSWVAGKSDINTQINLLCMLSFYYKIWNNFEGVTLPAVGRFSVCERKSSELWLLHNPEPLVEVS
jgi:hypothetical protein